MVTKNGFLEVGDYTRVDLAPVDYRYDVGLDVEMGDWLLSNVGQAGEYSWSVWSKDNKGIKNRYGMYTGYYITFLRSDDATAFKLRFGL